MNLLIKKSKALLICCWTLNINLKAETIHVAVAANFSEPAAEISKSFEKEFGAKVLLSTGSSGRLYAQIKNGAPWAVFLSADNIYTKKLIDEKLAIADSRKIYAHGKLALWSWKNGLIIDENSVHNSAIKVLALANARLAPYGRASEEVLQKIKFDKKKFKGKVVYGENISQTMNYIKTKNADLGFVSKSLLNNLSEAEKGSYWEVPHEYYEPIRQELVLLKNGMNSKLAKQFILFLDRDASRKFISESGYDLPPRSK